MPLSEYDIKYLETVKRQLVESCKKCVGSGYIKGVPCSCMLKFEEEIAVANAGIPEKYRQATFDNYLGKKQISYQKLKTYCEHLENARNKGIGVMLRGEEGAGKTFVGICILRDVMKAGYTACYTTLNGMLEDIKQSWQNSSLQKVNEEKYMWSDFLFVDAMNFVYREHGTTEWVKNTFENLIVHRDNHNRCVILSVHGSVADIQSNNIYSSSIYTVLKPKMIDIMLLNNGYNGDVQSRVMEDLTEG